MMIFLLKMSTNTRADPQLLVLIFLLIFQNFSRRKERVPSFNILPFFFNKFGLKFFFRIFFLQKYHILELFSLKHTKNICHCFKTNQFTEFCKKPRIFSHKITHFPQNFSKNFAGQILARFLF